MHKYGKKYREQATKIDATKSYTVREAKAGRVEFRVDKTGNLHVPIGKVSFTEDQLTDNMSALMQAVMKARPASAKGIYLKKVVVTSTMGPGVRVDPNEAATTTEA